MLNLVDPARCGCRNGVACRLCVKEARRRRGGEGVKPARPAAARRPVPCVHEGDVTPGCATCGQAGKTRECDRHGLCTREPVTGKGFKVCAACADYVADPTLLPKPFVPPPDIDPDPAVTLGRLAGSLPMPPRSPVGPPASPTPNVPPSRVDEAVAIAVPLALSIFD